MKVRNISDRDRVIAATSQVVEAGDTAEVDDEVGNSLLEQEDVWKSGAAQICDECGFEAENASGLASHQRTHNKQED